MSFVIVRTSKFSFIFCLDHFSIISLIDFSRLCKNLKPTFKSFLFDNVYPRFGISSSVILTVTFGLYFLHISATSLTVAIYNLATMPDENLVKIAWAGAFILTVFVLFINLAGRYIIKDKRKK